MKTRERCMPGDGMSQPLAVAAVTRNPDRTPGFRKILEALERRSSGQRLCVEVRQPENLRQCLAEVMKHRSGRPEAAPARPVRERGGDVCDGTPAIGPQQKPSQLSDENANASG